MLPSVSHLAASWSRQVLVSAERAADEDQQGRRNGGGDGRVAGAAPAPLAQVEEPHHGREVATVAARPGGTWALPRTPGERDGEIGHAEQAGVAVSPELRALRDVGVFVRGLGLVPEPLAQPQPLADQALVADVDHRLGGERSARRGDDEVAVPMAERLDHGGGRFGFSVQLLSELAEAAGPANGVRDRAAADQGAEERPGGGAVGGIDGIEDLLRVGVEGAAQAAERLVLREAQDDRRGAGGQIRFGARAQPEPVQDMLHQRQLVGAAREGLELAGACLVLPRCKACEVVEQMVHQRGLDREIADAGRAFDRLARLLAGHPTGEVEAGVDLLREIGEERAGAEIFRAHRDDDVDMRLARAGALDQEGGEAFRVFAERREERLRVVARGIVGVAEELLELIDQDEQVGAGRQIALAAPCDDRARAAAQIADEFLLGERGARREREQGLGKIVERLAARAEVGDQPARARARHCPELERVEEPGAHERGFAAAGWAEDGEESRGGESVDHLVHAQFAAEEEVGLVLAEGAEPGIGQPHVGRCAQDSSAAITGWSVSWLIGAWTRTRFSSASCMPQSSLFSGGSTTSSSRRGGAARLPRSLL